jgi:hypothetical protein
LLTDPMLGVVPCVARSLSHATGLRQIVQAAFHGAFSTCGVAVGAGRSDVRRRAPSRLGALFLPRYGGKLARGVVELGTRDAAHFSMFVRRSLIASSLLAASSLLTVACGPPPGMPPSPVNPPVKPPPPQTSEFDGEVMGADRQAPADQLAQGAQFVVRPGDDPPARIELAPGWSADRTGVSYSREREQQLVRGGTTNQGASTTGSWALEDGAPIFPPGLARPRPARAAIASEAAR